MNITAEILPAAFAPVPVIILAACLLLSLMVPGGAGRLAVIIAAVGSAAVFALWATSDATTCNASCSTGQQTLTLGALAVGPGITLLTVLVAAFRTGAEGADPPAPAAGELEEAAPQVSQAEPEAPRAG